MKPITKALLGFIPTILIIAIASWLTVNNCTTEQLKWTPLIIVVTMLVVATMAMVSGIIQDLEDEPDSILNDALDVGSLWIPFM